MNPNRLRGAVLAAFLAAFIPGCGEDQPNNPPQPEEVTPEFMKKTMEMMKAANAGMDPKKARTGGLAPAKK